MVASVWGSPLLRALVLWFGFVFAFWNNPAHATEIARPPCIAKVKFGDTVKGMWNAANRFDCHTKQSSFGPGSYWARIDGFHAIPDKGESLVFRTVSMWQDSASVYFRYADGEVVRQDYSAARAGKHLTLGAIFELPVRWRDAPLTGVLIKVNNSANVRGIVLDPKIVSAKEAAGLRIQWTALYACFGGIAMILLIYNLALWAAMRHRFQLYYCCMLAAMMAYTFSASGALILAFPEINNNVRLQFSYTTLALMATFAMHFSVSFFGRSVLGPKICPMASLATLFLAGTTLAAFLSVRFAPQHFTAIYYSGYLPSVAVMAVIAANAFRKGNSFFWMFLIAWIWPLLAGSLRWLHGIGLIPYSFWLDNSSILAFAIEAVVSSAVIAIRIKMLLRERDQARSEEEAARNLAIHDPLTGLLNRRGFMDAVVGCEGDQCLILIDIDHFKQVNDSFGHEKGDEVLRKVGLALKKWSPEGALIARLGGEEFAALLPASAAAKASAAALLERIRSSAQPIGRPVTASAGLATGSVASEADWRVLYRDADAALYRAKGDGRDRVSLTTHFSKAA